MDVFIYALYDPRDISVVRYIGKTSDPIRRLSDHMRETGTTRKCNWLAQLKSLGLLPIMEVVEGILDSNDEDWQERERYWIARCLSDKLTNLDSGGIAGKNHHPETIEKMSASRMGFKPSPETIAKITATKMERMTDGERSRLASLRIGQATSQIQKDAVSKAHKGRPKSDEQKRKVSLANKGTRPAPHTLLAASRANRRRSAMRLGDLSLIQLSINS